MYIRLGSFAVCRVIDVAAAAAIPHVHKFCCSLRLDGSHQPLHANSTVFSLLAMLRESNSKAAGRNRNILCNFKRLIHRYLSKKRSPGKHYTIALLLLLASLMFFLGNVKLATHLDLRTPSKYTTELRIANGNYPVLDDSKTARFANWPVTSMRPANQYISAPTSLLSWNTHPREDPILTVITITRNPRPEFWDTVKFVQTQSLKLIRWIIVNDHTDLEESYQMLMKVPSLDTRFYLFNNTRSPGFSSGRNEGLQHLINAPTTYFAFLDDDDMFELTAYEKCSWMLESCKNASICGTYVVGFGEMNYTWIQGLHNGVKVVARNPLTGSEIMRTDILSSGCRFDESLKTGMEDWEFYLCVAESGRWGTTIPEFLYWYRQNAIEFREKRWGSLFGTREETAARIQSRYQRLEDSFPAVSVPPTRPFEKLNFTLPFRNILGSRKNILFIAPWMAIGGGDTANLAIVKELSQRGYRVSIVCTLLNLHSDSMASRPLFMQYTHDVFSLPGMIRLADAPRFLSYLIESRGVELVLLSNSQLGYGLLPWLTSKYPDLRFVDYVHNEEPEWKNGGYASFSTVHQASLDYTFTSSDTARQFMIKNGRMESSIEVGYLGIDLESMQPLSEEDKTNLRQSLGIPLQSTVVIFLARMVPHKQPRVVLEAFKNAIKTIQKSEGGMLPDKNRYSLLFIGEGQMLQEIQRLAAPYKAQVRTLGRLEHEDTLKYLAASDIFCLPSTSEGVSFALAEAMAFGLAPLTSNVGGFPELLGNDGEYGVMLNVTGDIDTDGKVFTGSLTKLLLQRKWRSEIAAKAAKRVRLMFNAKDRIPALVNRILATKRRRTYNPRGEMTLSGLHYAQNSIIREMSVFSDFAEIHKSLQGKRRGVFGTKYRAVCGEYDAIVTRLIDILEKPKSCKEDRKLDVAKFRRNALEQCGRWCIMNLDDNELREGWHVRESCGGIDPFDDPNHKCVKWYKSLKASLAGRANVS